MKLTPQKAWQKRTVVCLGTVSFPWLVTGKEGSDPHNSQCQQARTNGHILQGHCVLLRTRQSLRQPSVSKCLLGRKGRPRSCKCSFFRISQLLDLVFFLVRFQVRPIPVWHGFAAQAEFCKHGMSFLKGRAAGGRGRLLCQSVCGLPRHFVTLWLSSAGCIPTVLARFKFLKISVGLACIQIHTVLCHPFATSPWLPERCVIQTRFAPRSVKNEKMMREQNCRALLQRDADAREEKAWVMSSPLLWMTSSMPATWHLPVF